MTHLHGIATIGAVGRGQLHDGEIEFGNAAASTAIIGIGSIEKAIRGIIGDVRDAGGHHMSTRIG